MPPITLGHDRTTGTALRGYGDHFKNATNAARFHKHLTHRASILGAGLFLKTTARTFSAATTRSGHRHSLLLRGYQIMRSPKFTKAHFNAADLAHAIDHAAHHQVQHVAATTTPKRKRIFVTALQDPAITAVKQTGSLRILSTDPDALKKLSMKLASMLSLQDNMLRTNEFLANHDRVGLLSYGYSAEGVEELFLVGPGQIPGFSAQELKNMATSIERVQDRIDVLTKSVQRQHRVEHETDYDYAEDPTAQRVMFTFPSKPSLTVRQLLGQSGFRWSPSRTAWTRPLSDGSIQAAAVIRDEFAKHESLLDQYTRPTFH
jgi:hypothetical protein